MTLNAVLPPGYWFADAPVYRNGKEIPNPMSDKATSQKTGKVREVARSALNFIIQASPQYKNTPNVILDFKSWRFFSIIGIDLKSCNLLLEGDGEKADPLLKETTKKIYQKMNVFILTSSGRDEISLPDSVKKIILNLLINGRPACNYCCVDFFMESYGFYSNKEINYLHGKWKGYPIDKDNIKSGDWIVIHDSEKKPLHFAVYVANGIYLSIFGNNGPLVATTHEEMLKVYRGVESRKLVLKGFN